MKKVSKYLSAFMAMILMTGCSGTQMSVSTSSTKTAGTEKVSVAVVNDLCTMDSSMATDGTSFDLLSLCMSGLMQYNENKELVGDLAESWDISEDGMTYEFHLRNGIQWSDGTPITANDFVYAWQRLDDPEVASEYAYILSSLHVKNADEVNAGEVSVDKLGVEAADDSTFVVTLTLPTSYFLSVMTFPTLYPLNEAYVKDKGDQYALSVDDMIYSGVYTMTQWNTGNSYVFTHNEKYWDEANYKQQTFEVDFIQDSQSAMLTYESGDLDLVSLTGDMVSNYKDTDGYVNTLTGPMWWTGFNMNNETLSNKNLRQAIAYSIDRATLCESVLQTGAIEADGLVAKGLVNLPNGQDFRDAAGDLTEYDPDKAGEYFKEAQKELGDNITIDLLYDDAENIKKVAENMQQMIQEACPGITITLNSKPKKTRIQLMLSNNFEMILTRWGPDYADPSSYLDTFLTGASMNGEDYSNAEFDAIETNATKGEDAVDETKRMNDMIEAEKILISDDCAISPIYQEGGAMMINPNVTGYLSMVLGTGRFRHMIKN